MIDSVSSRVTETTTKPLITITQTERGVHIEGPRSGVVGSKSTGFFLEWHWSGEDLLIRSHPNGFYPAYYYTHRNTISLALRPQDFYSQFGPFILDSVSFWTFLVTGAYVKNRTAFCNVSAIPEGGELRWSPAGRLHESARPLPQERSSFSYTQLIERYIDVFSAAIAKYPNAPSRLPLSGGRDSRHILLELEHQKMLPDDAVTVKSPPPVHEDNAEIAAALCKRVGIAHRTLDQTKNVLQTEKEKNEFNGLAFLEGAWKARLRNEFDGYQSVIWDGIGGDVLSESSALSSNVCSHAYGSANQLVSALYPKLLENYNTLCVLGLNPTVSVGEIRDHLTTSIAPYQSDHAPPTSFLLWNRTRRQIAANTVGCFNSGMIAAPFLEADLFDFLTSVPMLTNSSKQLHRDAIARAYPQYCDVPYARKRPTPVRSAQRLVLAKGLFELVRGSRLRKSGQNEMFRRALRMLFTSHGWRWNRIHISQLTYYVRVINLTQRAHW